MKTIEDLEEYIQMNSLENCRWFSEEETISVIIGHDSESGALVYEYGKLVESFAEHFRKYDEGKTEEEIIEEAEDWVNVNTLRSLPYKDEGYVNPIVIYGSQDWDDFCAIPEYKFDVKKVHIELVEWIKNWFDINGKGCNAVIGLSGGKDSTIAAALCVEALGKDRVIGVAMPDEGQSINDADKIDEYLGIRFFVTPINVITESFENASLFTDKCGWTKQAEQNIPPRIRMTMLYAIAQTYNGRPSCNCNLSEDYVGYATFGGDDLGAFAPLSQLTVTEIRALGHEMGIPDKWVDKIPDDGLPHSSSDEEKFGFSYDFLDTYIRTGKYDDLEKVKKIIDMHNKNVFKTQIIRVPSYNPNLPIHV